MNSVPSGPERGKPLAHRLAFRLAAALCLGAAAILVVAGAWNVALQREQMTRLVRESADRNADVILRSTRAAMLANAPEDVQRILDDVGTQRGIERLRIFDKQGTIRRSTDDAEVGKLVDRSAEQCFGCHRRDQPLERLEGADRMRTFRNAEGHDVLSVILPIRNEPDCAGGPCHAHPREKALLGVLDVHLSLAVVEESIARSERQMALGVGLTAIAVLVLSWGLTWALVLRPVRRLRAATERVAAGDLAARTPADSPDEIGDMARSWNSMVAELSRARDELQRWSATLETRVEDARRELETAHQRMLVVEKMASLGKLAAVMAHEINNPLAGIATYARLLRRQAEKRAADGGAPPDAETMKALDLVETEAQRCGSIVRNLLAFSRQSGGRFAEEDLRPVLDRCVALVHHKADLQQVRIAVESADDLPKVECDASQVQQVVLALAMNAIEAMPNGGTLTIRASRTPDGVAIEVADTGTGIPPEVLPHVFEPFVTTKPEGKGVGLGLAVVYGIVQRHHAQIDVETKVGAGTCFTVRIPLRQPPAPEIPSPGGEPAP
jgi:two-component system NtrC family sensor kinase